MRALTSGFINTDAELWGAQPLPPCIHERPEHPGVRPSPASCQGAEPREVRHLPPPSRTTRQPYTSSLHTWPLISLRQPLFIPQRPGLLTTMASPFLSPRSVCWKVLPFFSALPPVLLHRSFHQPTSVYASDFQPENKTSPLTGHSCSCLTASFWSLIFHPWIKTSHGVTPEIAFRGIHTIGPVLHTTVKLFPNTTGIIYLHASSCRWEWAQSWLAAFEQIWFKCPLFHGTCTVSS